MTAPHMELDVLGLLGACSYALDCVEAELVHVTTFHAKRVAYMSVCTAEQFGVSGEALQDLAACALLHDNALTQYLHEEFRGDSSAAECLPELPHLGAHCVMGEENISALPFHTNVENIILYHHENADGSGSFGKTWQEIPLGARIIRLCDLLDAFCRALRGQPDGSVTFVGIGPMKNIARFLADEEGGALMRAKARRMVVMAGRFETEPPVPEWNVEMDVPSARYVAENWMGPLDFCPFEALADVLTGECLRGTEWLPRAVTHIECDLLVKLQVPAHFPGGTHVLRVGCAFLVGKRNAPPEHEIRSKAVGCHNGIRRTAADSDVLPPEETVYLLCALPPAARLYHKV